jgi:predicted kinase
MHLIVVSGLPCSGKSKIAERLGAELHWPLLCKDTYKELLFDTLGYSDRAWSKRVSGAAYALQFEHSAQLTASDVSHVLEGNFRWVEHQARFTELAKPHVSILQVHCHAQPAVLIERFRLRAQSGTRHPGHVDIESLNEIEDELAQAQQHALPLSGKIVECDTSDDWQTAIDKTVQTVKAFVAD